jgi:hypothetical protein
MKRTIGVAFLPAAVAGVALRAAQWSPEGAAHRAAAVAAARADAAKPLRRRVALQSGQPGMPSP